ncbi:lipoprotein LpqH [Mycobacterium sp. NPDC003449]
MQRVAVSTVAVAVLGVSGCATTSGAPADSYTARMSMDGQDVSTPFSVVCTQRGTLWTIETQPAEPGFTAMVQTGAAVTAKLVRLRGLQGFTGSSVEGTDLRAEIDGATFTITGTADGSYADRPVKPATARYRIQAHC